MPTITLKEGDFGAGVPVSFGVDDLYLPDRERPGLSVPVPLTEVAEIESIEDDRSGQFQAALKLGAAGLVTAGPAGLVMGAYAATKVKDIVFGVRLQDGRQFVAVSDAKTFAELRSAQIAARASLFIGNIGGPADEVIAKYIDAEEWAPAEFEPTRMAPAPAAAIERRGIASTRRERPSFGRRRSD
ncbi:MAG: hypothetical protein WD036_02675 [Bauldia sp.]